MTDDELTMRANVQNALFLTKQPKNSLLSFAITPREDVPHDASYNETTHNTVYIYYVIASEGMLLFNMHLPPCMENA